MKNDRVFILRESVVKITQMLSGKGIKVTQQGVNAYVRADHRGVPLVVNLPYLPDNAGEDLCSAIQGFLDHEVAHILFTEFTTMSKAMAKGKRIGYLLNALEDPRIEKCMAKRFQGSAHNLAVTGQFYLDKFIKPRLQEKAAAGDVNGVIESLMVPMIRAMSGQMIFKEFMKDHWTTVAPIYERIKDLAPKVEAAQSTEDCFELAIEIGKRMSEGSSGGGKGEKEGEEKGGSGKSGGVGTKTTSSKKEKSSGGGKGKKEPEAEKSEEEEKKPSKGKGKSKEEKEEEAPSEEEKEKEKEGEKEPKSEKSEEKSEEEKSEEEESEKEPEPESEKPGEDESEPEPEISEEEEEDPEEAPPVDDGSSPTDSASDEEEVELGDSAAIWEEIDKNTANGYDEAMSKVISDATTKVAENADYLIFTKDYDVVEKLPIGSGYNAGMTKKLIDKTEHMVAPLQKDLERAIAARSLSTRSHGHRSGRLHAPNLSRLAVNDGRVFSRKQESTSKDVAVELVVDASGSMAGEKVHTACQAAYALASVLDRLGIKNEVICFTTKDIGGAQKDLREQQGKMTRGFSRVEGIYMPILKGYEERMTVDVKERFGWLPNTNILRSNVDGESIEVAARRLMARREAGKIMLVLSDGYPAAAGNSADLRRHLKDKVKDIANSGVKIIGIGIQSEAVREFYPKSLVLNNVEQLPSVVIKELRQLLLAV